MLEMPKVHILQRNALNGISVIVTKVEKTYGMMQG